MASELPKVGECYTFKFTIMQTLKLIFFAGLGGFFGSALRYLVGRLFSHLTHSHFPWSTFVVNIVGSFLIGLLFGLAERHQLVSPVASVFLITGFCGGLTTFSTFADDMYLLLTDHRWFQFALYSSATFLLGLVLVWLGRCLVKGA